jgi:flagellar hook-associated protein 1 FlgK
MPVSTFTGLNTSLRGLLAQQRALDVTSHNVANANTEGYSRQQAVMSAATALEVPPGHQLGTGVEVSAYARIRDAFLDLQYRAQAMQVGAGTARTEALERVELRLSEPGENGIAAKLTSFWNSWANLADAPESGAARQALVEQARTLATAVNDLDRGLQTVAAQAADEEAALLATGGEVHTVARELAALNGAIADAQRSGGEPNDLLDRRDLLLDQLSSLAQVSVADDGAGSIRVTLGGAAAPLVDGSALAWPAPAMSAPQGRLGALRELSSPTGTIAAYRADLASFAQGLATAVNAPYQAATGTDFLTYDAPTATLSLAAGISAATVRAGAGAAGDNAAARAISELRALGGPGQSYTRLVTRIGTETAESRRVQGNAEMLAGALEDRRQSTSGVSLDEEMTNLIRFQRGFQAASRAMSSTDEMLDVLINRTGRVGL